MSKIGIGIVTYQRLAYLQRAVDGIRRHTSSEYELVVAEDGGDDGTREWCAEQGIRVVTGGNGGVCWNKNRALFALQELGCDPILLLEDDCVPIADDWDWHWRVATALHGHLAFAHPKLDPWLISGSGTPTDPYVNNKATAQCSSASGIALAEVGFFDTRFKGYGVGHAEWTTRLKRAGFGFREAVDAAGKTVKANLYITGGLTADDAPTFKDKANIARNEKLFEELKREPVYRHPWSTDDERQRFLAEQAKAGIGSKRYDALIAGFDEPVADLRMRHLRPYNRAYRRAFAEPSGFLRQSGWLSSMAVTIPQYGGAIIPWYTYSAVHLLTERVEPAWSVFEYGAGFSTLWWNERVATVRSVDPDEDWADLVGKLAARQVQVAVRAAEADFAGAIAEAEGAFDVIVVNGPHRPACLRAAAPRLSAGGVIILNNANRAEYRDAIQDLRTQGFRELPIRGPAPMSFKEETTAFLYRDGNVLGL